MLPMIANEWHTRVIVIEIVWRLCYSMVSGRRFSSHADPLAHRAPTR